VSLGPIDSEGLAAAAERQIREAILEARLEGGARLSEVELSDTFGVSRAPVREALIHLEQEGLVTSSRYRATRVVSLSGHDIEELVTLRSALERLAWSRCSAQATDQDFADLEECVEQMRSAVGREAYPELVRLDVEFHDRVMRAARHQRLYSAWSAIKWQVALYLLHRRVLVDDYHRIIVNEHQQLIADLRSGQPDSAVRAVEEHIAAAHERLQSGQYFEPFSDVPAGAERTQLRRSGARAGGSGMALGGKPDHG
jgi:DNA-binding GntR family transcriptional regulator